MAEPLRATFFTFRKREKGALLGASISFGVMLVLLLLAFGAAVWAVMGQDYFSWVRQMAEMNAKTTPGQLPPNFGRIFLIFPIEMVWLFFLFVALAAFESACLRWMIRGERSGPFNLHFGADMWRVYGTYWMWFLYILGTYIVFVIVLIATGAIGAIIGGRDNPAVAGLAVLAVCVVWVLGWLYLTVRLAPAAATSVGVREFAPLKAWTVSRGRYWALFGSYLLVTILYLVAIVVVWIAFFGPMYVNAFSHIDWSSMGSDPQGFSRRYSDANLELMRQMFGSPLAIGLYVGGQLANQVVVILFSLVLYGINARAVIVAAEEGKVQVPGVGVAEQFS
ncbi:MAG: hypothetical protein JSS00_11200 [Proteobacteria bacterium]|nr:hypothetical protein [Pseudomonadota bacterium]